MKVLHVIPSVAAGDGGPARAVVQMVRSLSAMGVEAHIATTDDAGQGARLQVPLGVAVQHEGCTTFFFPRQTRFYKTSLPLGRWLREHVRDYDVVHAHALFSYAPLAAGHACRAQRVPYVMRPLGLLNRYGMEERRPWLKELSFRCVERPLLDHAAAIHYTSQQEADEAERLQLRARAAVIPLGLDLRVFEKLPDAELFFSHWPETRTRRIVLFLSRIDAKKGLDVLLPAFAQVRQGVPDAMLVIAGSGDAALEATLKVQARNLRLADDVLWCGFVEGALKLSALAAAAVYTLPSRSENFGIALLEAMAAGCACVATPGVALAHDAAPGSLEVVPLDAATLGNAMTELLNDRALAMRLGQAARVAAFAQFTAEATAQQLTLLYEQVARPRLPP